MFALNFPGVFRALFPWKRKPLKIYQKSPPFFNAKSPGKSVDQIHKSSLESWQGNKSDSGPYFRESESLRVTLGVGARESLLSHFCFTLHVIVQVGARPHLNATSKVCPSFLFLFFKTKEKPRKHQGLSVFSNLRNP